MSRSKTFFFIIFSLLLVALPFSKFMATLCEVLLLVFSLWRLRQVHFRKILLQYRYVASLALLPLMYLAGMVYTEPEHWKTGLGMLKLHHRFLAFPLIVLINQDLIREQYARLLRMFILGTAAAGFITLSLLLLPDQAMLSLTKSLKFLREYPLQDDRLRYGMYSPFIDRIQFSNLVSIAILFSAYLYLKLKEAKQLLFLGLLLLTSLLLGGRGAQIGLFAALLAGGLLLSVRKLLPAMASRFGRKPAILLLALGALLCVTVLPLALYQTVPALNKRYGQMLLELRDFSGNSRSQESFEHKTTIRRIVSWQNHWAVVKEHPLIGTGTGDYQAEMASAYQNDAYNLPVNAHSQYLQIWVTIGILGLLLFLLILFYWLLQLRSPRPEFLLALTFLVFYMVTFIPDAVLLMQIDNMAFALFFSMIGVLGKYPLREEHTPATSPATARLQKTV